MNPTFSLRGNRFALLFPPSLTFDVRQIEGNRFDRKLQLWSLPPSLRAAKALSELNFQPQGESLERYLNHLRAIASDMGMHSDGHLESVAGKELFPFQQEGVDFLRNLTHGLLYDQQGLGKTLEALAWAEKDSRVLVVCPNAVISQWHALVQAMSKKVLVQPAGVLPEDTWAITNYERLERLQPCNDVTLIIDEVQYIKNPKAKRSKLVLAHGNAASKVLALSGTPIINRPVEFWPTFLLLKQRQYNEFWGFVTRYCAAHQDDWGHWDFSGASHLDELKDDMLHFALRRTKAEVLTQLPAKRYTTLHIKLSKKVRNESHERDRRIIELVGSGVGMYGGEGLGALQRLRLHGANSKAEGAVEVLRNHFESGGGPVVVFSAFKEPLKRIARSCEGALYTGDETESERARAKHDFISGATDVICLTYGAGGVGLDGLQKVSDTVILVDLPWTPAETEQAEDRLHRLGQDKQVHIISLHDGSEVENIVFAAREHKMDVLSYLMEMK